jgi:hypothetical protein
MVVLGALMLALPIQGAPPRRASLQLASETPLVIVGRGFGAQERVLVTATSGGRRGSVTLVARGNGSFRARPRLELRECGRLTVRARGAAGSRAILEVERACEDEGEPQRRVKPPKRAAPVP